MALRILVIGKKHSSWVKEGIERYEKRLRKPFTLEWIYLPHSDKEGLEASHEESERILRRLSEDDFVVLLDERGKIINSPDLSRTLFKAIEGSKDVTLIIGGAYGVDERIRQRANFVWSLSLLVFPHQLVRLLLVEQLYRSQEISKNGSYHHE